MAARDGRGCAPASYPEFLHVDWSVSGRLKPEPSNEEEATEEGNFGVRVDVCPRDKSNEIHYNRGRKLRARPHYGKYLFSSPAAELALASLHR